MTPGETDHILWRLGEQDKVLEKIEEHAARTNGRVSKLELTQSYMKGAIAVLTAVVGIAVPVAVAFFS